MKLWQIEMFQKLLYGRKYSKTIRIKIFKNEHEIGYFFAENIFEYEYCITLTEGNQECCGNELATNSQNRHFKICEKMTILLTFKASIL